MAYAYNSLVISDLRVEHEELLCLYASFHVVVDISNRYVAYGACAENGTWILEMKNGGMRRLRRWI